MINDYLEKYPALRAIVLIIKAFLNQRNMNEVYSGGLGSYSIVCLGVSFLQVSIRLRLTSIHMRIGEHLFEYRYFRAYASFLQDASKNTKDGN